MTKLSLSKIPFYWGYTSNKLINEENLLKINLNIKNSVLSFSPTKEVKKRIKSLYLKDINIGHSNSDDAFNKKYTEEFLKFIIKNVKDKNNSILDIGAGGMIIPKNLINYGFKKITTLDPSLYSEKFAKKYNIKFIKDFFPSDKLKEKFDVIINADVFEHVDNPEKFLTQCRKKLKRDGLLIISTPDSNKNIKIGDVSMIMHEHLSYYDFKTIKFLCNKTGFKLIKILNSNWGGSIFFVARVIKKFKHNVEQNSNYLKKYISKARHNLEKIHQIFQILSTQKKKIAIYCPKNSFPYLYFKNGYQKLNYFLIDDNPRTKNKYIPGSEKIINNAKIINNKIDYVLIFSLSFGSFIKKKLLKSKPFLANKVFTLKELLKKNITIN